MGDVETVCCLCGDIGFPDKLFRCINCHNRFQHSYCSSYNRESSEAIEQCDWCQSESSNSTTKHGGGGGGGGGSSKKAMGGGLVISKRGGFSGDKSNKQHQNDQESSDQNNSKGKSPSPSPRTATRRYKLLKDVMC